MKTAILFILLLFSNFCFPQKLDSLENALKTEKDPKKKANLYLSIVTYIAENDSVKARKYIENAKALTKENDAVGQAKILNSIGYLYLTRDLDKAKSNYLEGLKILEKETSPEALNLKAKLWYNISANAQRTGNAEEALKIALQNGLPVAEAAPDKIYIINFQMLIGLIFYNEGNYQKALQYLISAEKNLKKTDNSPQNVKYKTLVQIYIAEVYLKDESKYALAKKRLDVAEKMLSKNPNVDIEAELFHLQSLYYYFTGQPVAALEKVEKGLAHSKKYQNFYQQTRLTFIKAKILPLLGRHDEAVKIILEMKDDVMNLTQNGLNLATIYEDLSIIEEDRGNYKEALRYANLRIGIMDSLHKNSQNQAINELETKYRTANKEKQLAQKELELSNKTKYMWILGLISLLFLSSAVFIYKNFRNKKKIAEQREINLRQKLREKEHQEELKVTKAILDGEERERERVAKDLHDGLGGMLAGVKINLSTWSSHHLEENQVESFHKILNQLDTSVSELRRVARNLMPESLLNFGLEVALKDLCEFFMKDGLHIDFQGINLKNNLPLNLQINIYRIVQELLANAVKHSGATNILVQCSQSDNEFYITVEDNGTGIKENDMEKTKSLGLKNLKNRVDFLKGKIEIQTEEKEGTSINIELKTNAVA